MTYSRPRPWIWLVILFLLPLVPWGIFIYLASRQPMQRLDKTHPTPQVEKGK